MAHEMSKYRVWNPGEGDEEDGREIEALDHECAAEEFADRQCSRDADYYSIYEDGVDLHVRRIDGAKDPEPVFAVRVTVLIVPEFYGTIKCTP